MATRKTNNNNPDPMDDGVDAIDLDSLEREGGSPTPFKFKMKTSDGEQKTFILSDPQEIDWQNLVLAMRDPLLFLRLVLPPDDHTAFFGTPMPSWRLNKLMEKYQQHYGLTSLPEASGSAR